MMSGAGAAGLHCFSASPKWALDLRTPLDAHRECVKIRKSRANMPGAGCARLIRRLAAAALTAVPHGIGADPHGGSDQALPDFPNKNLCEKERRIQAANGD